MNLAGAWQLNDTISLTANYYPMTQIPVPFGTASTPSTLNSSSNNLLEAYSTQGNASLYRATAVNLLSQGVYTVFMLGDSSTPTGILRGDR